MKRRVLVMLAAFSMVASLVFPIAVFAANAVLSFSLTSYSCSSALMHIDITLDSSAVREAGLVTLSDGTVLRQFEHASGVGTTYSGGYSFASWTAQPAGTIISLYGYIGNTPPTAADSVEFFIAYRCDTGQIVASCAGPAGSCPQTYVPPSPASVCLNVLDGRLNDSGAVDCAAPIVLFDNGGGLDVYGVGGGRSDLLFSIPDAGITDGTAAPVDATIPGTGQPVHATPQGGALLLEAFYEDGKPYTILYTPSGDPPVTHLAW